MVLLLVNSICSPELGAHLDPLADKALLVSMYVTLGFMLEIPAWIVIAVVSRDFLIVGAGDPVLDYGSACGDEASLVIFQGQHHGRRSSLLVFCSGGILLVWRNCPLSV